MISDGDKTANALYEKFNGISMPDQELSDDQIKSILAYISDQSTSLTKKTVVSPKVTTAGDNTSTVTASTTGSPEVTSVPVTDQGSAPVIVAQSQPQAPAEAGSNALLYFFAGISGILLLVVLALGSIIKSLTAVISERNKPLKPVEKVKELEKLGQVEMSKAS
jgi:hypothetical protein